MKVGSACVRALLRRKRCAFSSANNTLKERERDKEGKENEIKHSGNKSFDHNTIIAAI